MRILLIGGALWEGAEASFRRNIEGALVTFVRTEGNIFHGVEGNVAHIKEINTGRFYQQEFDILVNVQTREIYPKDDILYLQNGICPQWAWRLVLQCLEYKPYTTATIVGDCASAAQMAVNLYAQGVMPTIIKSVANFPKEFDPDVAEHLRKQFHKWGIKINYMTNPYIPPEEGRLVIAFSDQPSEEPSRQILAPNLSERFGAEKAAAVLNVVERCLVPPTNEGMRAVKTRFFQAAMTGAGEAALIQSFVNYIYSVLPIQGGFVKLIYGSDGKIYGFSAIGNKADMFVDFATALIKCGAKVETLANLDLLSPLSQLVCLGQLALEVVKGKIHMAYQDEMLNVNFENTTVLDLDDNNVECGMWNVELNTFCNDIIVTSSCSKKAIKAAKFLTGKGYKIKVLIAINN